LPNRMHVTATSAPRWIVDWDVLQDGSQLSEMAGSNSAAQVQSFLAATEMRFGI
jgi:hypothetical protein